MMSYYKEELIKKIVVWKLISIMATFLISWFWVGSIATAFGLAISLSFAYNILYFIFNRLWEAKQNNFEV